MYNSTCQSGTHPHLAGVNVKPWAQNYNLDTVQILCL